MLRNLKSYSKTIEAGKWTLFKPQLVRIAFYSAIFLLIAQFFMCCFCFLQEIFFSKEALIVHQSNNSVQCKNIEKNLPGGFQVSTSFCLKFSCKIAKWILKRHYVVVPHATNPNTTILKMS